MPRTASCALTFRRETQVLSVILDTERKSDVYTNTCTVGILYTERRQLCALRLRTALVCADSKEPTLTHKEGSEVQLSQACGSQQGGRFCGCVQSSSVPAHTSGLDVKCSPDVPGSFAFLPDSLGAQRAGPAWLPKGPQPSVVAPDSLAVSHTTQKHAAVRYCPLSPFSDPTIYGSWPF